MRWMELNASSKQQSLVRSLMPALHTSQGNQTTAKPEPLPQHMHSLHMHGKAEMQPLRDRILVLEEQLLAAESSKVHAEDELLKCKDDMTDLWGMLVEEKERSFSLARILVKLASQLQVEGVLCLPICLCVHTLSRARLPLLFLCICPSLPVSYTHTSTQCLSMQQINTN